MDSVAQKTASAGSEIEKLNQKRQAFTALGGLALGFGAAAVAGVGLAISKFADFDQAMSNVQASTHESATNMGLLRDAALDAGASTVYSATEAAGAIEELAKAGVSTKDILSGGLAGALDLAAAGQLGVARAAEITSTALNQFGLQGDEAAHVADVLAAGAGKAMGSVDDLAQGLKFVGPVAASMGVSLEETTGVLALFAQQGIIGEQAGTSLRGVLASLTSPSATARKEIERLGLTLYDSQGEFLGLENAAAQLSGAYKTMDGASRDASLGVIFGRETVTAATALYQAGAQGVAQWTQAVDDSGYAAQTARDRLDNLAGDLEGLSGAFDTALIQTGSAANDVLRDMVQMLTGLVGMYNDLPQPVQSATLLIGAAAAAVALAGGAALIAVPKWLEMRSAITASGLSMGRIALQGAGVGVALGVLMAVVGELAAKQASMAASAAEFADTLDATTGAVTRNTREMIAKKLADTGAFEAARQAGVSQKELTDALYAGGDAYEAVMGKLRDAHDASLGFNFTIGNGINAVKDMNVQLQDAGQRHSDLAAAELEGADASGVAESATSDQERALASLAGQANDTMGSIDELADTIRGFGSAEFDVRAASREFEAALDDLSASVSENGSTLDRSTEAGRANESAIDDLAQGALDLAAATGIRTGSEAEATRVLAEGRQRLIEMLGQFGITGQAAEEYADTLGLIPGNIPTAVGLVGVDAAEERLRRFTEQQRSIRVGVEMFGQTSYQVAGTTVRFNEMGNFYEKGKVKAFAAGGFASGIYPATPGGIHKFAEAGHDEAYITMDPKYRQRSWDIWSEVGRRFGAGRAAPAAYGQVSSPQPAMTLEGASITGELRIGGDGLGRIIDGRITMSRQSSAVTLSSGSASR
ncbi:phage tail tape measure protein [Microbacterium sp. A1-JK]|uniref:phage tail tape measure protein n=1 Tax=Microbacterium sp. A1-JK TaxID=3177516 RepID=UPI003887330F